MLKVNVEIKGISPLLVNRFRDKTIEGKSKKRTGATIDEEIENKLWIHNKEISIPGVYIRNSLIEAGKQFKIVGKGKATYSKLIGATVEVNPEKITLKPQKYEVFSIAAVNPSTKGRVMTHRPRFNEWNLNFEIVLNDDGIPTEVINEELEYAGRYVGIGDWRPAKKGMFGKFMITSFKEVK